MTGYNTEEVKDAMLLRSLDLMVDSWENDDLTLDQMTNQLEAANSIASGDSTFNQFLETTELHNREKLN